MSVTVIASTSQTLWRILESRGVEPGEVFRDAGLDPRRLQEPGARFDDHKLDRAWARATELTGDPCIGLRAAGFTNPGSLQALGFAWLVSDTLYDALSRLVRYSKMISDGAQLELSLSGDQCSLAITDIRFGTSALAQRIDAFWSMHISMCRTVLSEEFTPLSLDLRRPEPPCVADFYALFRAPIRFAARQDRMVFPRDLVEQPLPTANRILARHNEQAIADYLKRLDADSFSDKVRTRLVELLPSGRFDEGEVARALTVSRRTLQRRLSEEDTTYSILLDEARHELAVRFMGEEGMSIKQATYLLGFSEPGNFSRAFKRWTGEVPSRFREQMSR
jgi:AraC-like DNA-binding protein